MKKPLLRGIWLWKGFGVSIYLINRFHYPLWHFTNNNTQSKLIVSLLQKGFTKSTILAPTAHTAEDSWRTTTRPWEWRWPSSSSPSASSSAAPWRRSSASFVTESSHSTTAPTSLDYVEMSGNRKITSFWF